MRNLDAPDAPSSGRRHPLSSVALVAALGALTPVLSGCDSECSALDTTTTYGFDVQFDAAIPLSASAVLEMKVYWNVTEAPLVFCASDENQNVFCTSEGSASLEDQAVSGIVFNSNSIRPEEISVVLESHETAPFGPTTLVAQGEATLEYQRSTHEILCSDGETKEIERATATIELEP